MLMFTFSTASAEIYENKFMALITGMFSSARYFTETMIVSENRVLPPQSGWTVQEEDAPIKLVDNGFSLEALNGFNIAKYAQHDLDRASRQSTNGWYHQIIPPIFVGLTIRFGGVLLVRAILFANYSNYEVTK